MSRLVIATCALIFVLATVSVLARAVGQTALSPLATLFNIEIGADDQACWHGICPGKITLEQASRLLNSDPAVFEVRSGLINGDAQLCWSIRATPPGFGCLESHLIREAADQPALSGQIGDSMFLDIPGNGFRLGDTVLLLGEPLLSSACLLRDAGTDRLVGRVAFKGNIVVQTVPEIANAGKRNAYGRMPGDTLLHFTPRSLAFNLWIYNHDRYAANAPHSDWKGFSLAICR